MSALRHICQLTAVKDNKFAIVRTEVFQNTGFATLAEYLKGRPVIVFTSPTVHQYYGQKLKLMTSELKAIHSKPIVVPTTEQNKNLHTVEALLQTIKQTDLSRNGVIISVGGGILLDIVGLAAGLYRRGVSHIRIGTTLLAQVDAAIGLKCGVNVGHSKNLAGLFHAPELVITDGHFLNSVSQRHIACGLAEMIKLAVVRDERLFVALENVAVQLLEGERDSQASRQLIDHAIVSMIAELQPNPYEADLQRAVDFGHTISPRLESDTNFELHHGEAVAIDLAYFCVVASVLGLLQKEPLQRIISLLDRLGIPRRHYLLENIDFITSALAMAEAQRGGHLHLPLPTGIGSVQFITDRIDLSNAVLREAAEKALLLATCASC